MCLKSNQLKRPSPALLIEIEGKIYSFMAKICLIIGFLFLGLPLHAEMSFRSGLLIYTIYDESDIPYVRVTDNIIYEKADIVIPDIVEHDGISYPVRSIGSNAFKDCKNIGSVVVMSKVRGIDECSFYNSSLERIVLPDSLQSIGYSAFSSSRLQTIDIPDGCIYIDSDAFYTCSSLETVKIGKSVRSIGSDAFGYCSNLHELHLPSSDSYIWFAMDAFRQCDSILEIYYNTMNPVNRDDKSLFPTEVYKNATLYVPIGAEKIMMETKPWMYFIKIQEINFSTGIEDITIDNDIIYKDDNIYLLNGQLIGSQSSRYNIPKGWYIYHGKLFLNR